MDEEPFGAPPELPSGFCGYQEPWDRRQCGASVTVHGITADGEAGEGCDKHRDILEFHSMWVHAWEPVCAGGRFVSDENRCAAAEEDA